MQIFNHHKAKTTPATTRPLLFKNAVLTILNKSFCVIGQGRVESFNTDKIILMRLPGVLTMPIVAEDETLYLQGENETDSIFTLETTVSDASRMYITVSDLKPIEVTDRRMHTRYVINRQAEVINIEKHNIVQPCMLSDISLGGARIISNYEYPLDKQIRLRVELYDKSGPISFLSQIVRTRVIDNAQIEYGLLFAELTPQQRRYLTEDLRIVRENISKPR